MAFLARVSRFLFLHLGAKLLAKQTAREAFQVAVKYCPKSPAYGPIALNFAENNSCAQNMTDGVHPSLLVTLEVWIDYCYPVIDFLQC